MSIGLIAIVGICTAIVLLGVVGAAVYAFIRYRA
jgi:hypothetical protein